MHNVLSIEASIRVFHMGPFTKQFYKKKNCMIHIDLQFIGLLARTKLFVFCKKWRNKRKLLWIIRRNTWHFFQQKWMHFKLSMQFHKWIFLWHFKVFDNKIWVTRDNKWVAYAEENGLGFKRTHSWLKLMALKLCQVYCVGKSDTWIKLCKYSIIIIDM